MVQEYGAISEDVHVMVYFTPAFKMHFSDPITHIKRQFQHVNWIFSLNKIQTYSRIPTGESKYGNVYARQGGFSRNIQLFFSSPSLPTVYISCFHASKHLVFSFYWILPCLHNFRNNQRQVSNFSLLCPNLSQIFFCCSL